MILFLLAVEIKIQMRLFPLNMRKQKKRKAETLRSILCFASVSSDGGYQFITARSGISKYLRSKSRIGIGLLYKYPCANVHP